MNVVEIVVGPTGFVGAPEHAIVDYIRSAFADRPKPDLIVTLAGPAAAFARKYRQQLFPDVPLLLASVNQQYLRDAPLGENETAVAVANDFPGVIDLILELLPQTKQVFVVVGSGQSGTFWGRELQTRFTRFQDRLTFIWSGGLSLTEILRQSASLPRDSAILYFTFGTDARGGAYADARVLADLHAAANAPLFGLHSVMLGSGIVGGKLINIDEVNRSTADAAIRILAGTPPRSVIVPPQPPGNPVFDWRELQRWGIPESRLPAGSVVRYRDPSLWQQRRGTVLSAVGVLAVQSLLIVGLLYQRRKRQRAEIESDETEREAQLLRQEVAHVGRVSMMGQLASALAHEINQPLGAILRNAEAAQLFLQSASPDLDEVRAILADIVKNDRRACAVIDRMRALLKRHELEAIRLDMGEVIGDVVMLMRADAASRHVKLDVDIAGHLRPVRGDRVHLQQVLLNLVLNGIDAVNEANQEDRRVTVTAQPRGARIVEVAVGDTGPGIPADILANVFEPFFSTKPNGMGMGLPISRTIIEAHGGELWAGNNHGGGATLRFTLPIAEEAAAE